MIQKKYYKLVKVSYEDSGYLYLKNVSNTQGIFRMVRNDSPTTTTNLNYSLDGVTWTAYDFTNLPTVEVPAGANIYFRGTNNNGFNFHSYPNNNSAWSFYMDVNHIVGGNVFSLRNPDPNVFQNIIFENNKQDCKSLFYRDIYLTDASSINFGSSTSIAGSGPNYGCSGMFYDCTSLTTGPDLSNITSIEHWGCYYMFNGCTSLTTGPDLSSLTSVGSSGCSGMFYDCTSLTTGPDLSSLTSVGSNGCKNMFTSCSNLSTAYTPNIDAWDTSKFQNWLQNAGTSVTGTKTVYKPAALSIPADSASGVPTGWTTTNY